jgi:hypothetical protein
MTASSRKGRHEIACEFLSRAIELYLRGDSDFSALHLAGAAEEVFSVMVRELPTVVNAVRKPSLDEMKDAIVALSAPGTPQEAQDIEQWAYRRMTDVKNSIKHMRGLKDIGVSVDIREEAQDVIDRAISTYFQLASRVGLPLVKEIEKFDARVRTGAQRET